MKLTKNWPIKIDISLFLKVIVIVNISIFCHNYNSFKSGSIELFISYTNGQLVCYMIIYSMVLILYSEKYITYHTITSGIWLV